MNKRTWGVVEAEGDNIFYKVTGEGPTLVLLSCNGGNGDLWLPLADLLSDKFKVITYDRRPSSFDISQEIKDVIAILTALGETSSHFLGSGTGAVIALELATNFPKVVNTVIIHEAPLAMLHYESAKWLRFFKNCYNSAFKLGGSPLAFAKFLFGLEVPAIDIIKANLKAKKYLKSEPNDILKKRLSKKLATDYLIKQELLPITNYNPDIETLRNNNSQIVVACGDYAISRCTWIGNVSTELASLLSSKMFVFPGHHASFMDNPKDWAKDIKYIINHKSEEVFVDDK